MAALTLAELQAAGYQHLTGIDVIVQVDGCGDPLLVDAEVDVEMLHVEHSLAGFESRHLEQE